jgi:signal transduction histidine kinase
MGLYIVQEIVHRHGGDLQVESAAGQGSCFRVMLPARGRSARSGEAAELETT